MHEDPIVANVRKARERLAEKYDFNIHAIFEDLRRRQCTVGKRLIRRVPKQSAENRAAPDRNFAALHPGR